MSTCRPTRSRFRMVSRHRVPSRSRLTKSGRRFWCGTTVRAASSEPEGEWKRYTTRLECTEVGHGIAAWESAVECSARPCLCGFWGKSFSQRRGVRTQRRRLNGRRLSYAPLLIIRMRVLMSGRSQRARRPRGSRYSVMAVPDSSRPRIVAVTSQRNRM